MTGETPEFSPPTKLDGDALSKPPLGWRFVKWLIGSIVLAALTGSLAAHLPQPLRKLVLVAAGCGIVVGAVTAWWAAACDFRVRPLIILVAAVLSGSAFALCGLHTHRLLREAGQAALKQDLRAALLLDIEKQAQPDGGALQRTYEPAFADYLELRVAALGRWPRPWPVLFWAAELVVSGIAGAWMAAMFIHRCSTSCRRKGEPTAAQEASGHDA